MEHYLYEKDNQGNVTNYLECFATVSEAVTKAKRLTEQWANAGVTRHYLVTFHSYHEWEN